MKNRDGQLDLSATDISNFLGCRHRIGLEMSAAAGEIAKPVFDDPELEALFRRGLEHERRYVASLAAGRGSLVNLSEETEPERAASLTIEAMAAGADVIVQGALRHERWQGRPDVLVRASTASRFGAWSYEV
ncbi:MAG TPA: nuclease, partial [Myxococcota bacterium]|nr:nuclease [Myxococcota bacterium]